MDRENKTFKRFLIFLIISLFLHGGILYFMIEVPLFRSEKIKAVPPNQEVVFVRPEDILSAPPRRPMELADIAKPKVQKAPKKARFASQYNSTVPKETVARKVPKKAKVDTEVSEEPKKAKIKKRTPNKKVAARTPEDLPQAKYIKPSFKEISKEGKKGGSQSDLSYSDLQLKPSDFKDLIGDQGKGDKKKGIKDDRKPLDLAALPRRQDFSGPGDRFVHDFMPHVKIGDKTYLNTQAFPDVQYFTRLKRIFRLRFNPRDPLISHFRQNRVVVGKVNVTMAMEVSASGQLTRLFVLKSSGIPGYDREALRTVRQSAPFSAPPTKVLSKDGKLRMTWHFTTYL